MGDILLWVQWIDIVMGILVLVLVVWRVGAFFVRLAYGPSLQGDEVGAPEGDARNFRLRTVDDDKLWEDL